MFAPALYFCIVYLMMGVGPTEYHIASYTSLPSHQRAKHTAYWPPSLPDRLNTAVRHGRNLTRQSASNSNTKILTKHVVLRFSTEPDCFTEIPLKYSFKLCFVVRWFVILVSYMFIFKISIIFFQFQKLNRLGKNVHDVLHERQQREGLHHG